MNSSRYCQPNQLKWVTLCLVDTNPLSVHNQTQRSWIPPQLAKMGFTNVFRKRSTGTMISSVFVLDDLHASLHWRAHWWICVNKHIFIYRLKCLVWRTALLSRSTKQSFTHNLAVTYTFMSWKQTPVIWSQCVIFKGVWSVACIMLICSKVLEELYLYY